MAWDREKERKAGKAMTLGSSIFGLVFSIFWCVMAASMGAGIMLIFGIPFVGLMIYRLYVISQYAKETDKKEADPWDRPAAPRQDPAPTGEEGFCPYCGGSVQAEFDFCPKCGRRQPQR